MKILDEVVDKGHVIVADKLPTNSVTAVLFDYLKRPETNGLPGLVQKFEAAGLGPQIKSWMGEEKKLPITPVEVTKVFGEAEIKQMAGKLNLPVEKTTTKIAETLPDVISNLAPEGKFPVREKTEELVTK